MTAPGPTPRREGPPPPPDWLDPPARATFERLAGEIDPDDPTAADVLAIYAAALARMGEYHGQLVRHGLVIPQRGDDGRVTGLTPIPQAREFRELATLVLRAGAMLPRRARPAFRLQLRSLPPPA